MKRRLFVLYEHGEDLLPRCTGPLRLLRPLNHPRLRDQFEVTAGRRFDGRHYDAVIVERMWRPSLSPRHVEKLIADIRRSGSPLLFAIDDNIFDVRTRFPKATWFTPVDLDMLERLATSADGILVSTDALRERVARYHDNVVVLPNALDERLLVRLPERHRNEDGETGTEPLVIGYMGTPTHDDDLQMIAPALREVHRRYGERVRFELLGVVWHQETLSELSDLPIRVISPPDGETDYPQFMLWYLANTRWDIALAPLCENAFNACKSDIKLLDYGAIGAVGVYSRARPYENIEARGLGLLADNHPEAWIEALDRLLTDSRLRAQLRRNSQTHVLTQRTIWSCAENWSRAFDSLLS